MNKKTSGAAESIITPDNLSAVINEMIEISNLSEFLCMYLMRAQEGEHELSFSFGEGCALVSLMQGMMSRIVAATGELTDLKLGIHKADQP